MWERWNRCASSFAGGLTTASILSSIYSISLICCRKDASHLQEDGYRHHCKRAGQSELCSGPDTLPAPFLLYRCGNSDEGTDPPSWYCTLPVLCPHSLETFPGLEWDCHTLTDRPGDHETKKFPGETTLGCAERKL